MSIQLFNTFAVGKAADPEGHVGPSANFFLPFYSYGYWFANGKQYTFLTGEAKQKSSQILRGTTKPNTFRKDASSCPNVF